MSTLIKFTENVAENYEKYRGSIFFEPYAKDIAERLQGNINSLIEIACGTGQVTRQLIAKFPDARITATDLNPGMLDVAKKILNGQNNLDFQIADAQELPFDDNTFDAVICQFGLMFLPDKKKGVDEAYRVLKPGGKFIFNTWDSIQNNPIIKITERIVNSFFDLDPVKFWDTPFSMYDPDVLAELMAGPGFKNISVQKVNLYGYSPSAQNAAVGLTVGSPAHTYIIERSPDKLPEIQEKIAEGFIKEFGEKDLQIPLSAFVAEGVK